ncbi:hypothetical protein PVK06_043899 [Gossypium arboreum]|uniref:3-hydroxyisobutyrate dehydrogenase n=1 Tax=Gossypium arboreum TaxID=29729 RepID=A0ABR0MPT2_GOSAR|nr:hypothetical protein PVK06_043899 [Gossypium arboreum]
MNLKSLVSDSFETTKMLDVFDSNMKLSSCSVLMADGSKFQHQKSNVAVVDLWRSFSNYAENGNGNDKENVAGVLETNGDLKPKFQGEKRAIQAVIKYIESLYITENWENPVMLDAPVSRCVVAAEAGSLTFMVGGSEDVYLAAKSLLLSMGKEELQEAIDFISLFG